MIKNLQKYYTDSKRTHKAIGLFFFLCILASSICAQTRVAKPPQPTQPAPPPVTQPAPQPVQTIPVADTTKPKDKISLQDYKEIGTQAQTKLRQLQMIMTNISSSDNVQSDVDTYISQSYTVNAYRVFQDKNVIIADDTDPQGSLAKSQEVPVEKYLRKLDANYKKTQDGSISFSNFHVSHPKKKKGIYIKVRFSEKFDSKYNLDSTIVYPERLREAEFSAERAGPKKWDVEIINLRYYDPAISIDSTDNDIVVASDTTAMGQVIKEEVFSQELQNFLTKKEEDDKKKLQKYTEYTKQGDEFAANQQYKEALSFYTQAQELIPLSPALDKKILQTKKLDAENTFDHYHSKGVKEQNEHDYKAAILDYKKAISLKSDESTNVQPVIDKLTKRLSEISVANTVLKSGDYHATIQTCEKTLSLHEGETADYSELYFIMGSAYEKTADGKPGDKRDYDKALENYITAIQFFTNYKEARIAHARLLVKYRNDYANAIADFDALASNELDDSHYKPLYLVEKAKLEDKLHNTDDAMADYNTAIKLSKGKNDTIYYEMGELLYRKENYTDAEKSLDAALRINPRNSQARYYRGLCFAKDGNNDKAGDDFTQAIQSGLTEGPRKTIDSISNVFFSNGTDLFNKHDFTGADANFDKALKISHSNADALYYKAQIRLVTGNELSARKSTDAADKYKESIKWYKKSESYDGGFSDAFFKEGLAQFKIKEYDQAVSAYTKAIKADSIYARAYSDYQAYQACLERGKTLLVQKKYEKAVSDFDKALTMLQANYKAAKDGSNKALAGSLNDDMARSLQFMGEAQYHLGEYPFAIISLTKAVGLMPTNHEAYYYRGLTYYVQHETSKSIRDLDDALKYNQNFRYYLADGNAYYQTKEYEVAIKSFSEAILMDTLKENKNTLHLLGRSYYKAKQWGNAINNFTTYSKTAAAKTDTSFFVDYGEAQLFAGQDTAAFRNFKYALTLLPDNARALYGVGCYYVKSNQFDKAIDSFQKAFFSKRLTKEDIKPQEEAFFEEFNKNKAMKNRYSELRKQNLNSE